MHTYFSCYARTSKDNEYYIGLVLSPREIYIFLFHCVHFIKHIDTVLTLIKHLFDFTFSVGRAAKLGINIYVYTE